jgi:hypothetical protein
LFVWLYRLFPKIADAIIIVRHRDRHWLASCGVPGLAALEVPKSGWAP